MNLETKRLIIRPWQESDIPHYMAMSTDVGYNCFSTPGIYLVKDESEALKKIQARMKVFTDKGLSKFPMFEKESGAFVGTCGGDPFQLNGKEEVELGYRLMLSHWNKGYATEAANALCEYLLWDLELPGVFGFALPENGGSIKVLEKVGFQYQQDFMWANLLHKLYKRTS